MGRKPKDNEDLRAELKSTREMLYQARDERDDVCSLLERIIDIAEKEGKVTYEQIAEAIGASPHKAESTAAANPTGEKTGTDTGPGESEGAEAGRECGPEAKTKTGG